MNVYAGNRETLSTTLIAPGRGAKQFPLWLLPPYQPCSRQRPILRCPASNSGEHSIAIRKARRSHVIHLSLAMRTYRYFDHRRTPPLIRIRCGSLADTTPFSASTLEEMK
jgi:hypothetical protein